MKHKQLLSISAILLLTALLLSLTLRQKADEALAARLAPDILRFHILADSNSREDQQLKLEVRDLIIRRIQSLSDEQTTKEETIHLVLSHKEELENLAHRYLLDRGKDLPVTLSVTKDYFPTKVYGDLVFPCGSYETARMTIGSGKGRNWWCVLYPPLCYTDSIHAIVPEPSKESLAQAVGEDDYDALLPRSLKTASEDPAQPQYSGDEELDTEKKQTPQMEIRFFLLDLITGNTT